LSNKSEATWHPNDAPEVPHADLIADLRGLAELLTGLANRATLRRAADALAALGDTVPREQYDLQLGNHADDSRRHLTRARSAERERDEARAERDALAHVIEQVRIRQHHRPDDTPIDMLDDIARILDTAPAVSLARQDAVAWDQGYQSGFERGVLVQAKQASGEAPGNPHRAAAIREEAK
jgi:hypothetical protein